MNEKPTEFAFDGKYFSLWKEKSGGDRFVCEMSSRTWTQIPEGLDR